MHDLSDDARQNQAAWDARADAYQRQHGPQLGAAPLAWGVWSIPESELNALGDVAGRDVLELGCGAGQWSIALAQRGARAVGLDSSAAQLRHARAAAEAAGVDLPLLHASAEAVPLPDASFDLIFCDHGALSFLPPERALPEVARLLRPGGRLAFTLASPLLHLCYDPQTDTVTPQLQIPLSALGRVESEGFIEHPRPHSQMIRCLRENGLLLEDLRELCAPPGATTTYTAFVSHAWAQRWPAEDLWIASKPRLHP